MTTFDPAIHPHRQRNILNDDWVLVSPHRTLRPWLGQSERLPEQRRPAYDPDCYLCPGNRRAAGIVNPPYRGTFVFDNDFPALSLEASPRVDGPLDPLLQSHPVRGVCRVVCFSERHDLSLAELSPTEIAAVVDVWAAQTATWQLY